MYTGDHPVHLSFFFYTYKVCDILIKYLVLRYPRDLIKADDLATYFVGN